MKSFKIVIATTILPITASLSGCAESAVDTAKQPNIILIMVDDLGWSDPGYMSDYYNTPNIDKLKSQGIYFPNGYASASNSAPSRASMLTGRYNPTHGVYTVNPAARGKSKDRQLIPSENSKYIKDGIETLPEAMKKQGYNTCHIGKWHITENPLLKGVDINIGGNGTGHPKSYFSPYKNANLKNGVDGEYLTDRLGDEAVNYLNNSTKSESPFFLYFAPYAVHTPLQAKPEIIAKYTKRDQSEGHFNPTYAAMIESMDANVGKLLEAAEKLDNTIIILTSDNGGVYNISRQWPLRAGKGSFYEGGIRVPYIIYQKGVYDGGVAIEQTVSQIDIFPTLLAISGSKSQGKNLDGVSLVPLLKDKSSTEIAERALFWHFPAYLEGGNIESKDIKFRSRPVSVIRKGDWKLIQNLEDGELELYNIKEDISEKNNIIKGEKPNSLELYSNPKVKELFLLLEKWQKDSGAAVPTERNPEYVAKKR